MNKVFTFLFAMLILTLSAFAQNSKIDGYSALKINSLVDMNEELLQKELGNKLLTVDDGEYYIKCLVKSTDSELQQVIEKAGGTILYKAGSIWGTKIPLRKINQVIASESLQRLSISKPKKLQNDKATKEIGADKIHAGINGLNLEGENVIVGVIDTGIDLDHPDFKDENGTRIKFIWDMSDASGINNPEGFEWGREFSSEEINNGMCTQIDLHGHGTHVTGTAAGNGSGDSKYKGIAPKSDIIVVKCTYDVESDNFADDIDLLAAVFYVFERAAAEGKPAVINMSLGSTIGSHDGTDLFAQGLSELVDEGRIIVVSAGNDGELEMHTGVHFTESGELYETVIYPINVCEVFESICPDIPGFYATAGDFWYTSNSIDSVFISAYDINENTGEIIVLNTKGYAIGDAVMMDEFIANNETLAYIQLDFSNVFNEENNSGNGFWMLHNGGNQETPVQNYFWSIAFKTIGEGTFDMWSGIPVPSMFGIQGIIGNYLPGTNSMTIGNPADAKRVISVGSYVTRNEWVNDQGEETTTPSIIGELSSFSSRGPTRDGRIVPIISAPGEMVISAKSSHTFDEVIDEKYTPYNGTSMSAPVVSGTIAFLLQLRPDLNFEELVEIISEYSIQDEFTGEVPNNNFGWGKLNAEKLVSYVITTNVEEYIKDNPAIKLFPNPASNVIEISGVELNAEYIIIDAAGKVYSKGTLNSTIDIKNLSSGTYYINLRQGMNAYAIPFNVIR